MHYANYTLNAFIPTLCWYEFRRWEMKVKKITLGIEPQLAQSLDIEKTTEPDIDANLSSTNAKITISKKKNQMSELNPIIPKPQVDEWPVTSNWEFSSKIDIFNIELIAMFEKLKTKQCSDAETTRNRSRIRTW